MKRKYLIIVHNYWPAFGGAEKLLQSIAENLKKAGENVEVLTSNAKNGEMYFADKPEVVGKEKEIINGVFVQREDIRNIFQKIGKRAWKLIEKRRDRLHNFGPIFLGPHFVKSFLKYIFSKKYTHIICGPFPTSVPFYGYFFKIMHPKTKLIIDPSLHVNDPMHTGRMLQFVARRADSFLVRTKEETLLLNSWGVKSENIFEIGVGIDEKLLENGEKSGKNKTLSISDYILYMGQEVPHKNVLVLLESMKKIWNQGYNTNLLIAGARTSYSRVVDDYIGNIDPDFRKLIFRINDFDESLKRDLIDNCKFLVMPSSRESFGIVFIEAWARKKAVIGARVSGVRYLIDDGKNGLLFKENDSDDLAEKVIYLLENENIAKEIGEEGHDTVLRKYRWGKIMNKILSI